MGSLHVKAPFMGTDVQEPRGSRGVREKEEGQQKTQREGREREMRDSEGL